eukprot:1938985-Rhodomonas_salina.1
MHVDSLRDQRGEGGGDGGLPRPEGPFHPSSVIGPGRRPAEGDHADSSPNTVRALYRQPHPFAGVQSSVYAAEYGTVRRAGNSQPGVPYAVHQGSFQHSRLTRLEPRTGDGDQCPDCTQLRGKCRIVKLRDHRSRPREAVRGRS